ncbi:V-set and immunoglobulin domain-containing protein 10-like 2 isoform X1 [Astyanax mexicanus]|nr:V-set and immunoglobulin domain-containing protein 10-like 2 isoform X1 [Astyanax mexicanus]
MGTQLDRTSSVALLFLFLLVLARGLEIPDPDHIAYIHQQAEVKVNGTVSLRCGTTMPTLFIWVFSKNASDSGEAIAYNYGLGPKVLPLAASLGDASLPSTGSTLLMKSVWGEGAGQYTCQALYDTDDGPRVTFYYTQLSFPDQNITSNPESQS